MSVACFTSSVGFQFPLFLVPTRETQRETGFVSSFSEFMFLHVLHWDITNDESLPVASSLYVCSQPLICGMRSRQCQCVSYRMIVVYCIPQTTKNRERTPNHNSADGIWFYVSSRSFYVRRRFHISICVLCWSSSATHTRALVLEPIKLAKNSFVQIPNRREIGEFPNSELFKWFWCVAYGMRLTLSSHERRRQ